MYLYIYIYTCKVIVFYNFCTRIYELKRDIQARIGTVTKAGQTIENFGGETFLSQEVAINILQDTKNAFKRCHTVSKLNFIIN